MTRGIHAKCPGCGAYAYVGIPITLESHESLDRFWAQHLQSCGWAPAARTILGQSLGLEPISPEEPTTP